ncbi:MAG: DUF6713 family protein [Pseudomonadota bacterium]
MKSWLNLSLITAFSLLAVHEMDAMTHAEWRLLPGLSQIADETARGIFVWLHIPLYIGALWALFLASWRRIAGRVFSAAMIAHAFAHFVLSGHELYTFMPPIETVTVYGAALAGAVYLTLSLKGISE